MVNTFLLGSLLAFMLALLSLQKDKNDKNSHVGLLLCHSLHRRYHQGIRISVIQKFHYSKILLDACLYA